MWNWHSVPLGILRSDHHNNSSHITKSYMLSHLGLVIGGLLPVVQNKKK